MKKIIILIIISSLSYFSFGQHPTNLVASNITSSSADLSCDATVCNANIHYRYRAIGGAAWINNLNINSNTHSIASLSPNTIYEWSVKCAGISGWSTTSSITTLCNLSTTAIANNSNCDGSYDGSASIVAFNGTPPYSYLWNNNNTTSIINNITNSTYIVNTSDSLGCSIVDTILVDFDNIISLSQFISDFTDTSRLEYPNTLQFYNTWAYDTLRLVNNGCNINIRPEFRISHQDTSIQQGQIELKWKSPMGFLPIQYDIDNNGNAFGFWNTASSDSTGINAMTGSVNEMILRVMFKNQAPHGKYTAIWSTKEVDNLGNIIQTVTQNDTAIITLVDCNSFQSFTSQANISCWGNSNGIAAIDSIANGSGNYSYNWVDDNNQIISTNNSISNLSDGNYSCTILDNDWGCSIDEGVTILEPLELTVIESTLDASCYGDSNGVALLIINGGTIPYNENWNGEDQYNLQSGDHQYIVTDDNGCTFFDSVYIYQPSQLISSISTLNITNCASDDGEIDLSVSGGSGSYSYIWSNGGTTQDLNNLSSGTYSVTITDIMNCTIFENITIYEPNELTSTYTQTNVSCYGVNDGGAIVNFFGGASGSSNGDTNYILGWAGTPQPVYLPYPQTVFNTSLLPSPYNAIPAGIYPYTVTDLNGCIIYDTITITEPDSLYISYTLSDYNGYNVSCFGDNNASIDIQVNGGTAPIDNYLNNTLQSALTLNNLTAGNYTDSIVDVNGCISSANITLYEPSELVTILNSNDISCYGLCNGEIYSTTTGGSFPYYYLWGNTQNTEDISNLCDGYQTLTVTDYNGCINNTSAIINTPNAISATIDSNSNISNYGGNNGFIYITTNGGSGLLNTNWTSLNNYSSNSNDILNLYADIYFLEVSDTNLCTYLDTVELSQPSSLWISIDTITSPSCYDSCNGAINITANGGDSIYSYSWIGPNGFTSNNYNINNLCSGEYIIILNDGITNLIDTLNIYQPQQITTLLSADSIICHNGSSQAQINVWGGSQPFTYSWSNGDTNYYTTVSSGNHSIDISDINGCSYSQNYSLSNPDSIFTQTTSTNTSCYGGNNGIISINITNGGISPYNFSNDNGINYQISNTFSNLIAGNYSFQISDDNGCLGTANTVITEPSAIISATTSIDVSCYGYCDGGVAATALGGTTPYSYTWTNGTSGLCAGFYNVIISDANGCINSNSAIVIEPNPLIINISINGSNIIANSGFASYQWYDANNNPINGATDSIFTPPLGTAFYYVTAIDSNGCSVDSSPIEYTISRIEDFSSNINIFPNPTNQNITVISEHGMKTIKLYNTIGNELYSVNNKGNMINETKIDLSTFAKGVYFIKININNHNVNQRIILQ